MEGLKVKEEDVNVITVRVIKEGTSEFHCTVKRDIPLQNLMISFCKAHGLGDLRSFRFGVNGSRVRGNRTIGELRLKNGSVIDAWCEQTGGSAFIFY